MVANAPRRIRQRRPIIQQRQHRCPTCGSLWPWDDEPDPEPEPAEDEYQPARAHQRRPQSREDDARARRIEALKTAPYVVWLEPAQDDLTHDEWRQIAAANDKPPSWAWHMTHDREHQRRWFLNKQAERRGQRHATGGADRHR